MTRLLLAVILIALAGCARSYPRETPVVYDSRVGAYEKDLIEEERERRLIRHGVVPHVHYNDPGYRMDR